MLGVVGVGGGWRIPSGEEEGEDWGRGTVTCDSQAHDTNLQAPRKSALQTQLAMTRIIFLTFVTF